MPNYNAQNPLYSICPGDVALAFNNESPATGQASQQFALSSYSGFRKWPHHTLAGGLRALGGHDSITDSDERRVRAVRVPTRAANMATELDVR